MRQQIVARTHHAVEEQQPIEVVELVLDGTRLVAFAIPLVPLAVGILGAQAEVYRDAFDEVAPWVDLGEDENGRTSLEGGRLFMSIKGQEVNFRDWYELAEHKRR